MQGLKIYDSNKQKIQWVAGLTRRPDFPDFTLFNGLRNAGIPMYVFHSWRPIGFADETADFLIVTKSTVISLEIKAFELEENPVQENIDTFNKVLLKSLEQQSKVRQDLKEFLTKHGCTINNLAELPLITLTLFSKAKNRGHHISNISLDFENKLASDNDVDPYTKLDFRDRILFNEEYLVKLKEITDTDAEVNSEHEFQLRMLLAWFYGTYAYEEVCHPDKSDSKYVDKQPPSEKLEIEEQIGTFLVLHQDKLERTDSHYVSRNIDEAHKKSNSKINGIFLTHEQLDIINCTENFLAIVGFPGTGKTYCLLARMMQLVKEIICPVKLKKQKVKSSRPSQSQFVIFVHEQILMLKHIESKFWESISQSLEPNQVEMAKKLVLFLARKDLESASERFLECKEKLSIFYDDYANSFASAPVIVNLMKKVELFWYTCYSSLQWFDPMPFPYSHFTISEDHLSIRSKYAVLNHAVRVSAQIHALCDVLVEQMPVIRPGEQDDETFGPRKTETVRYDPGTRVIGDQVKFVSLGFRARLRRLKDSSGFLKAVLQELDEVEKLFQFKDVLLIAGTDVNTEFRDKFQLDFFSESEGVCERQWDFCEIVTSGRYAELTVASAGSARGREKECVIIATNWGPDGEDLKLQILLDDVTRAISKVVLIYFEDDSVIGMIADKMNGRIPQISTLATGKKPALSAVKQYQEYSLTQLLNGDPKLIEAFSLNLHNAEGSCYTQVERYDGHVCFCNLSCTERAFKEFEVKNESPIFELFQKACHYQLVLREIHECSFQVADRDYDENPERFHRRMNKLFADFLKWLAGMNKESASQANVDIISLQYRLAFHAFTKLTYMKNVLKKYSNGMEGAETLRLVKEFSKQCLAFQKAGTAGDS